MKKTSLARNFQASSHCSTKAGWYTPWANAKPTSPKVTVFLLGWGGFPIRLSMVSARDCSLASSLDLSASEKPPEACCTKTPNPSCLGTGRLRLLMDDPSQSDIPDWPLVDNIAQVSYTGIIFSWSDHCFEGGYFTYISDFSVSTISESII